MGYAVGIVLAWVSCTCARGVGFDRDRAFYPTALVVIASYYVRFAVMGGSTRALVLESVGMSAFAVFALAGFTRNMWLVVGALAAHAVFDFFHAHIVDNPGVPEWWPAFCLRLTSEWPRPWPGSRQAGLASAESLPVEVGDRRLRAEFVRTARRTDRGWFQRPLLARLV
jgi:hypothetical protein